MLNHIEGDNLTGLYKAILGDILDMGELCTPRGKRTLELHPYIMVLNNPINNCIFSELRAVNPLFMLSEFLWIMLGMEDVEFISKFNKAMKNFSDDGVVLRGAYGPRLRRWDGYEVDGVRINCVDQIKECAKKLHNDLDSRQALMCIFNPYKDYAPTRDVPCNILLKFTVRNRKLDLTAYVRSQDMLLGFPYDVYHWTMLQQMMANELGISVGTYYHIMDSAHIYEHDFEWAKKISKEETQAYNCWSMLGFESLDEYFSMFTSMSDMIKKDEYSSINSFDSCYYIKDVMKMFKSYHNKEDHSGYSQFSLLLNYYRNRSKNRSDSK